MGILSDFFGFEAKASAPVNPTNVVTLPTSSAAEVRADILNDSADAGAIVVNSKTALQVSAALSCARVIAEGLAQVPCKVFREDKRGSLIEAADHPLFNLLSRSPNDWQTSFEFREQIGIHLAFEHNAYVYINRALGKIVELYAFEPANVSVTQNDDMTLTYKVSVNGKSQVIPATDMWHIRGFSTNGYQGNSLVGGAGVLGLAAKALGLALSTEAYGSKLFENGARPGGILTARDGTQAITPAQRNEVISMWKAQNTGLNNAHRTTFLPYNLEWKPINVSADDAQWIESRKFLIEEICRFFRVLPIMVMQSGATSYASVEQLFLAHQTHTLMPLYQRFEQSAEKNLLTPEELNAGYRIKLNANAMLRGSTAERTAYYNAMVTLGVMSVNDVRAKEDLPLSADPEADKLRGAANLFGSQPAAPTAPDEETPSDNDNNNEVSK